MNCPRCCTPLGERGHSNWCSVCSYTAPTPETRQYDDGLKRAWGMLEVMVLGVWVVLLAGILFSVLWDLVLTVLRLGGIV